METLSIEKNPKLEHALDYAWLRQQGLEYIQELGSKFWTDYNIHDPGITLLEQLCYAQTELGYRTSYDIKDLLAVPPKQIFDPHSQAFFSAREILTCNPWTIRDFRKLLIDIDGIKNGWLKVSEQNPDGIIPYVNAAKMTLQYKPQTEQHIRIKGLYEVTVEFDDDNRMGNLNSGKILYNFSYKSGDKTYSTALIEIHFPKWQYLQEHHTKYTDFRSPNSMIKSINVDFISDTKSNNANVHEKEQADALRRTLYATFKVDFYPNRNDLSSVATINFTDVPMRVWFNSKADRKALQWNDLLNALADPSPGGLTGRYLELIKKADTIMNEVVNTLHSHRNLCEDYYSIKPIEIEDIAVCIDIEVDADVDVDAITAEAYFLIDRYISPEIKFYTLKEMLDKNIPVEEIFEGPVLKNGFVDNDQVDTTNLKKNLYASDIINLLMDIPGVKSVKNFLFSKYDDEGIQVGNSQPWEIAISEFRQPRLYLQACKIVPYKNGLYFAYSKEVNDVYEVLKNRNTSMKDASDQKDITVPLGSWSDLEEYFPVQYQLPLTYGVGYEGLPGTASVERKSQALQLKAYVLFFEQLFVNYLSQLSHISDLFNIDDYSADKTYFSRFINDSIISNIHKDIYPTLNKDILQNLVESTVDFFDRRNRFLDHQLARFAETFSEYALMLYNYETNEAVAADRLIKRKINFLKDFPQISSNRGKTINYKDKPYPRFPESNNMAGLSLQIKRLLGLDKPEDTVLIVEHLLLRPRHMSKDRFLDICVPSYNSSDGIDDPYSFRITILICGEGGEVNSNIQWRQFAEKTIRREVPAHIGVKICWVSRIQLEAFTDVFCSWLEELSKEYPDKNLLTKKLSKIITIFKKLKSIYPPASLFSCRESTGNDRVFLNQTIISSKSKETKRL